MTGIHILRIPMKLIRSRDDGERWCFVCRKRVRFLYEIHAPIDPMSWYGPNPSIKCEHGHLDGDCFPGREREWSEA